MPILETFSGIAPKYDPRKLSDGYAQIAKNAIFDRGALHPIPQPVDTTVDVSATAKSLYKYNASTWLAYSNFRTFARVPIANDVHERVIITDPDGYPLVYSAGTSYRVGIPAPSTACVATATEVPTDDASIEAETVSYVVTFVDAWGMEGPPSSPSASIDRVRNTQVNLTSLPAAPAGNYNFGAGALKRIYRSNAGSGGAFYQFAGEVLITATTFADTVDTEDLGEILPTNTWIGPPDDDAVLYPDGPMLGVVALPNGVLAGFAGKMLCFSEPYLYHAWPAEYRLAFDENIVGIASISAGLAVMTERRPYIVTGIHPSSMAATHLDVNQACVSQRGVVDMGEYAVYPSPDGLVGVAGSEAVLLTDNIFTREQWQAYNPETIHAYEYEGRYIAFYDDTAGFIFDPRAGARAFTNIDNVFPSAYYDPPTDTLYVNDSGNVSAWAQNSSEYNYQWKSGILVSAKPTNYSVLRVHAHDPFFSKNITVKVWADGVLKATITFNGSTSWARLPSGFRAREWEIEVTGANPVSYISMSNSMFGLS